MSWRSHPHSAEIDSRVANLQNDCYKYQCEDKVHELLFKQRYMWESSLGRMEKRPYTSEFPKCFTMLNHANGRNQCCARDKNAWMQLWDFVQQHPRLSILIEGYYCNSRSGFD